MARLRRNWLPFVFLLCALPTGLGVVLLTPIGEIPDEPEHISRADGLLSWQIIGTEKPGSDHAGVVMNAALFAATIAEIDNRINQPLTESARRQAEAVSWGDHRYGADSIYCPTQMVRYFPAFYTPGALGILAGRTLGISPLHSLFLGRFFMLLSFLILGFAALRLARFGQPLLFAALMLPMTLYLAGSYNQDGPMIGATVLAAALLTRPLPGPSQTWFLALLLLTLVACAKAPYAWLLLACLLPLARRNFMQRLGLVAIAAAMPVLWLWATRHVSAWPWPRPAYHPGPLWPGSRDVWFTTTSVGGSIEVLVAHPAQIILLPFRFLIIQGPTILHQMVGSIGWLRLPLPPAQYAGWLVAGAAAVLAVMLDEAGSGRSRGVYLILLLATMISVTLSSYITYNNVGDTEIGGMQGRYFLPLLPYLIFILPLPQSWRSLTVISRLAALPTAVFCLPAIIMAVLDIIALPAQIFRFFQMPGP